MGFRVTLHDNKTEVIKYLTHDPKEAKTFLKLACRTMHEKNGTLDSMGFDMDDICVDAWDPRKAPITIQQGNFKLEARKG